MSVSSYSPSAKFAPPRSYLWGIHLSTDHEYAVMVDNVITAGYFSDPDFLAFIILKEQWPAWSNYAKTLDWIVEEAFWTRPSTQEIHDYAIAVEFQILSPTPYPVIHLRNVGSSANNYLFELQHEPESYWLHHFWS